MGADLSVIREGELDEDFRERNDYYLFILISCHL